MEQISLKGGHGRRQKALNYELMPLVSPSDSLHRLDRIVVAWAGGWSLALTYHASALSLGDDSTQTRVANLFRYQLATLKLGTVVPLRSMALLHGE